MDATEKVNVGCFDWEQPKGENKMACEITISLRVGWTMDSGDSIREGTHVLDESFK